MAKLNLVIADTDESYVEGLYNFIMGHYANRFHVRSYTKKSCLYNFLSQNVDQIDILLVSLDLYSAAIPQDTVKTLIILSAGKLALQIDERDCINKYQHGDKLIKNIIQIFTDRNQGAIPVAAGNKQTKIVGVYSPIGGAGKTTLAVGLSMISAGMGSSVFYLNLENIHSTQAFFKCEHNQNLSNILYHLKEKNKNMILKIEACRCIDEANGVHYFLPPDSVGEMDDMLPEDLQELLRQFKIMGEYHVVFVDMSSSFDRRNIAIMEACDDIIVIAAQGNAEQMKMNAFKQELDIISRKYDMHFSDKMTFVLNKCREKRIDAMQHINDKDKHIEIRLPFHEALTTSKQISRYMDTNSAFGQSLNRLARMKITDETIAKGRKK